MAYKIDIYRLDKIIRVGMIFVLFINNVIWENILLRFYVLMEGE